MGYRVDDAAEKAGVALIAIAVFTVGALALLLVVAAWANWLS